MKTLNENLANSKMFAKYSNNATGAMVGAEFVKNLAYLVKEFVKMQKRNRILLSLKHGWKDYCWYCDRYEFMGGTLVCVR